MQAVVYKSTGSWYQVKTENGEMLNARIRGNFRIEGISSTNPIAVGDKVRIELEDEQQNTMLIVGIDERNNYITRQSPHNKNQHHIIAANLDQTLLFATLKEPRTSNGFIDRFLVGAETYHVPAIIVFNKLDVYGKKELARFQELKKAYESCGYKVLAISVKEGNGLAELTAELLNKTTLVSGHSGVGKSTFINHLFPHIDQKTQEVSGWSGKGLHTTTFAEMFDLPNGGSIIDTPGIREFALFEIERSELAHYFPEMRSLLNNCQFNNCVHINEPGCAVKKGLSQELITEDRYLSYLSIFESIPEQRY
jgi:ribosome biogenesis GTPase / thiamine phosphate phosphatase